MLARDIKTQTNKNWNDFSSCSVLLLLSRSSLHPRPRQRRRILNAIYNVEKDNGENSTGNGDAKGIGRENERGEARLRIHDYGRNEIPGHLSARIRGTLYRLYKTSSLISSSSDSVSSCFSFSHRSRLLSKRHASIVVFPREFRDRR